MSALELSAWRADLLDNLRGWEEPDGILCGSEQDPAEREACRQRLRVAVDVLDRVLRG